MRHRFLAEPLGSLIAIPVYTNAYLAVLNSRESLRERASIEDGFVSVRLSRIGYPPIQSADTEQSSKVMNMAALAVGSSQAHSTHCTGSVWGGIACAHRPARDYPLNTYKGCRGNRLAYLVRREVMRILICHSFQRRRVSCSGTYIG